MLRIDIWPEAQDFIKTLSRKHKRQISARIYKLAEDPLPSQSKLLQGFPLRRLRAGIYRIVYFVDGNVLKVPLIDHRNDDRIYRRLRQQFE